MCVSLWVYSFHIMLLFVFSWWINLKYNQCVLVWSRLNIVKCQREANTGNWLVLVVVSQGTSTLWKSEEIWVNFEFILNSFSTKSFRTLTDRLLFSLCLEDKQENYDHQDSNTIMWLVAFNNSKLVIHIHYFL